MENIQLNTVVPLSWMVTEYFLELIVLKLILWRSEWSWYSVSSKPKCVEHFLMRSSSERYCCVTATCFSADTGLRKSKNEPLDMRKFSLYSSCSTMSQMKFSHQKLERPGFTQKRLFFAILFFLEEKVKNFSNCLTILLLINKYLRSKVLTIEQ